MDCFGIVYGLLGGLAIGFVVGRLIWGRWIWDRYYW